jgi:ubiquinone/menaquinone biosynthesis C-methylase UbiE
LSQTENTPHSFESLYLKLREKEGRVYDTDAIRLLPEVTKTDLHYSEWIIRKRSAEKFARYLELKGKPLHVLEVGCGNGWLTHFLAKRLPGSHFTGMDVNHYELTQAMAAFPAENILWLNCDPEEITSGLARYDIIFFAASIQYFEDISKTLIQFAEHLKDNGEIHILDSPWYESSEIDAAKKRSIEYYYKVGFPEMAAFYFPPDRNSLQIPGFATKKMNRTTRNRILKLLLSRFGFDYFEWWRIKKLK